MKSQGELGCGSNFGSSAAQGMARAAVGNCSGGPWAAPPRKRKPPPAALLRICELSKNSPARCGPARGCLL